jgi:small subunit ribosomal protein S17
MVTTETKARKGRRTLVGVVSSALKTPKTIRVDVQYQVRHPKYGKTMNRTTRVHAHDEKGEARMGDHVELMECRPISKTKTWRLVRIVVASKGV